MTFTYSVERIKPLHRDPKTKKLFIEKVLVEDLVRIYDTPLYVVSEEALKRNYEYVYKSLSSAYGTYGMKVVLNYAMKAFSTSGVLRILNALGAHLDTVHINEVKRAFLSGYTPDRIFYTGTANRADHLIELFELGVQVNLDDVSDLYKLSSDGVKRVPKVLSFRVVPEVGAGHNSKTVTGHKGSKFGVPLTEIADAYNYGIELGAKEFGIHCHIGSGSLDTKPFIETVERMMDLLEHLKNELGIKFKYIDLGGGFGVPYLPDQRELDLIDVAEKSARIMFDRLTAMGYTKQELPEVHYEPGRIIVCDTTVILGRVHTLKKNVVGTDIGMDTLLRPAMYGAYHHIVVDGKTGGEREYSIVGPICESGDVLAEGRKLPELKQGDVIAVLNAGAYGITMASEYNSRGIPPIAMVSGDKHYLIRKRDTINDLIRNELMLEV